eukprot:EG_transcript_2491
MGPPAAHQADSAAYIGSLRLRVFDAEMGLAHAYAEKGLLAVEVEAKGAKFSTDTVAPTKPYWNQEFTLPIFACPTHVTFDLVHFGWLDQSRHMLARSTLLVSEEGEVRDLRLPLVRHSSKYLERNGTLRISYQLTYETTHVEEVGATGTTRPATVTATRSPVSTSATSAAVARPPAPESLEADLVTCAMYYDLARDAVEYIQELMFFVHGGLSVVFCCSLWFFTFQKLVTSWLLCWFGILILQLKFQPLQDPRTDEAADANQRRLKRYRSCQAWREVADVVEWLGQTFLFGEAPLEQEQLLRRWVLLAVTICVVSPHWLILLMAAFQSTVGLMYYHRPAVRHRFPPFALASLVVTKAVLRISALLDRPYDIGAHIPRSGELHLQVLRANTLRQGPSTFPMYQVQVTVGEVSYRTQLVQEAHTPAFPPEKFHFTVLQARAEVVVVLRGGYAEGSLNDLGTAVFCLTTHQANVTEVVELRTEDNAGAGYVAMVYTFGPRDLSGAVSQSPVLHAFVERKFADYGSLQAIVVEGRGLDSTGPFSVDILVDGKHRHRTGTAALNKSTGSWQWDNSDGKSSFLFPMDSRMADVMVKLYDVGTHDRIKVGQGNFTVKGMSQDFQTEWVKLRSKAGKKAGEVRVDYLARYKDDNSFLEALSDEANKQFLVKPERPAAPLPKADLAKALAQLGFYRHLQHRTRKVLMDLLLFDVHGWSLAFVATLAFACLAHRLVGFAMAWLAVAGYQFLIHPLSDDRRTKYREHTDAQLIATFHVAEDVRAVADALETFGQRFIFWKDEQTMMVVHGFVTAAVLTVAVTLHWPLTVASIGWTGVGLAYYAMPQYKADYPPEELLGKVLVPLLGHNPITPRNRPPPDA